MCRYLLKRLLLIPLTLLSLSLFVFCLTRLVPGGPIEQLLQEQAIGALSGDKGATQGNQAGQLSDADREKLEELFNLHEPTWRAYLQWLGLIAKESQLIKAEFDTSGKALLALSEPARQVLFIREGDKAHCLNEEELRAEGWYWRIESPQQRAARFNKQGQESAYCWRLVLYRLHYDGLFQGSLGNSYKYNEPVINIIMERLPISIYLGLLGAMITYGISLPLGVMKAIWHKSYFDSISSFLLFVAYAIPGFALGAILLVYLGARLGWFPLYGLISPEFEQLSFVEQIKDIAMHTVLPLSCYVVSSFAMITMMMKNNLMEQMSSDYVRTAVAKGLSFPSAVWRHAMRNALIPIASGLGGILCVIVGGSLLIERVFDIQGFGLLSYQALVDKDYTLIMGTLMLSAVLILLGNLLADLLVLFLDKRIRFHKQ